MGVRDFWTWGMFGCPQRLSTSIFGWCLAIGMGCRVAVVVCNKKALRGSSV